MTTYVGNSSLYVAGWARQGLEPSIDRLVVKHATTEVPALCRLPPFDCGPPLSSHKHSAKSRKRAGYLYIISQTNRNKNVGNILLQLQQSLGCVCTCPITHQHNKRFGRENNSNPADETVKERGHLQSKTHNPFKNILNTA